MNPVGYNVSLEEGLFMSGFTTTSKVPIPEALRKELEKAYLHSIVKKD